MYDTLRSNPRLQDFFYIVELAGLGPRLASATALTVFVPVNATYRKLPSDVRNELLTGSKGSTAIARPTGWYEKDTPVFILEDPEGTSWVMLTFSHQCCSKKCGAEHFFYMRLLH
jgi:uncharacterized surface protein with fasciclin (FAS1) repeats